MYKLDFMVKYKEMEIEFENKIEKGENEDLYEKFKPNLIILSQNEIHPKVKIKTFGEV